MVEFDGAHIRSRCRGQGKDFEILSRYKEIGPDRLQVTRLDVATGAPDAAPVELMYRIDDRWLLTDLRTSKTGSAGADDNRRPIRIESVSVRVRSKSGDAPACQPRSDNHIRVGRTPPSSLALTVPAGWEPVLVDPATNLGFSRAIAGNFLIGAFMPKAASGSASGARQIVFVLDDVRYGPFPVRQAEFRAVKKRFINELGTPRILCNLPDRVCGTLNLPIGMQAYTELTYVNGRVAMITGSVDDASAHSLSDLRKSVEVFVSRLRADNAE